MTEDTKRWVTTVEVRSCVQPVSFPYVTQTIVAGGGKQHPAPLANEFGFGPFVASPPGLSGPRLGRGGSAKCLPGLNCRGWPVGSGMYR
jgi:hypothetical protein